MRLWFAGGFTLYVLGANEGAAGGDCLSVSRVASESGVTNGSGLDMSTVRIGKK